IYKSIKVSLSKKLSSIDKDKTLEKEYNNILKISEDFPKLKNFKTYKEIINDIETINTHLVALRTFYNKYTTIYNKMIKTPIYFPFVKHKKLTLKKYYEEKVLNDTINF
ncbi:MAG: LemA family protein, partial [Bacilli bacterium]